MHFIDLLFDNIVILIILFYILSVELFDEMMVIYIIFI
jgi:hypothetical protein